ncbi:hypothetical protein [Marinomonas spartinae]|uniref:hypothetical protein n=1 Tax=Marinomonas spartinae TaxID=1792290 RepID=UPI0018F1B294|nr:hypothetical protein [Marinomonas spartinae]MBJ7553132.1 hypothetical protein [Marinomonas spartinae]
MIYAIHNAINSESIIDFDYISVAKKLQVNMDGSVNALSVLMDLYEDNTPLSDVWPNSMTFNYFKKSKEANLDINLASGWGVFSEKAFEVLKNLLAPYGEFLKISVEGDTKYIFNCLMFGEENTALSDVEYVDGLPIGYRHIAFNEADVVQKVLFKSRLSGSMLFCNEVLVESFKAHQLKGLTFTPVEDYIYKGEF